MNELLDTRELVSGPANSFDDGSDASTVGLRSSFSEVRNGFRETPEPRPETPMVTPKQSGTKMPVDLGAIDVFVDEYEIPHCWESFKDHRKVIRLKSKSFRNSLIRRWLANGEPVSMRRVQQTLLLLEARADLSRHPLANRSTWGMEGEELWIDLADDKWRAVRVSKGSWKVAPTPRPMFRRFAHQRPLPLPNRSGDLRYILDFLAPMSEGDEILLLVWLVLALMPIPRPILMFTGPHGSGKTTTSRCIRRMLDPSKTDELGRDTRADLPLTLHKHACPLWDNVDVLSGPECDLFCQAHSGRGIARRKLYTDDDEFILSFQRPLIFNGLHLPTSRPDLLDRMLIIPLDRVSADARMTVTSVENGFRTAHAALFGGLLNALAETLSRLPDVTDDGLSRMADFHRAGRAAALALGVPSEQFDEAMRIAISRQQAGALDNPLALALLLFARSVRRWQGEPQELFERIIETAQARQIRRNPEYWPETAAGLGRRLKNLKELLTRYGVKIERPTRGERRLVLVEYDVAGDTGRDDE